MATKSSNHRSTIGTVMNVRRPWAGNITSGDQVTVGDFCGTLGVVMTYKKDVFGLTAGHVLQGNHHHYTVKHRVTQEVVDAHAVIKPSEHEQGFASEVGIIQIDRNAQDSIDISTTRCDMYGFNRNINPATVTTDEINFDPSILRSFSLASKKAVEVYKDGATSGLTMGELVCIRQELPSDWGCASGTTQQLDENRSIDTHLGGQFSHLVGPHWHRWVGYVKPLPGQQYSDAGDSGALVYALNNSVKIPLGIHLGKPAPYGLAYGAFVSLETFLLAAEAQIIRLSFEN